MKAIAVDSYILVIPKWPLTLQSGWVAVAAPCDMPSIPGAARSHVPVAGHFKCPGPAVLYGGKPTKPNVLTALTGHQARGTWMAGQSGEVLTLVL